MKNVNIVTEVEAPDFVREGALLLAADDEHVRVDPDGRVTVQRPGTVRLALDVAPPLRD